MDGVALKQEDLDGLIQHLQFHADFYHKHKKHQPRGFHYYGLQDFVLDAGQPFLRISPDQPSTDPDAERTRYRPRVVQNCFHNARCAASASKGKLRYVEGFAFTSFIPVLHAWNIDGEDRVVDTTWCGYDPDGEFFHRPLVGKAYYGVIFELDFVRATATDDNCSMIDRWQENYPLLREPWPKPDQVAA